MIMDLIGLIFAILLVAWVTSPLLIYLGVSENNTMLKGIKETIDGLNSIEERLSRLEHLVAVSPAQGPASDSDEPSP